jgi:glycosyltransferase involved in cell wall biosynthesis
VKKVLLITYYWPPAGGPGVQRVLKSAKYLPEFGWKPVILTVENGDYPAIDQSLLADIPPNISIYKTRSWEPFRFYRKLSRVKDDTGIPTFILNPHQDEKATARLTRWLRANLFIPDARVGWVSSARRLGLKLIKTERIDLIWSSSPPHSLQLIAQYLAHHTGAKWIAYLRDHWTEAFWQRELPTSLPARLIHSHLEQQVLKSATAITTVSSGLQQLFKQKTLQPCYIIPNGYDPEDFTGLPPRSKNDCFTIVYTGNLGKDQSLLPLINALQKLPERYYSKIALKFFGDLHPQIKSELQKLPLKIELQLESYQNHKRTIKTIHQADILLLIIPNTPDNQGIVTGKLFEYLATGNPILAIGPINGNAAQIIRETSTGEIFDYATDLCPALQNAIDKREKNNKLNPITSAISGYSRRNLTEKLVDVFNAVLQ